MPEGGIFTSSVADSRLRVACLSTYLPRRCGIATYTANMIESASADARQPQFSVLAISDTPGAYKYGPPVIFEIAWDDEKDYARAAELVNESPIDVVSVQHEFGIFGGENGHLVLEFLRRVKKPVVVTLHTILAEPDMEKVEVVRAIARRSTMLVAMLRKGIDILEESYGIPRRKVTFVPHGVPAIRARSRQEIRSNLGLDGSRVICTFGLINPGKGIEYMIMAMPEIVKAVPDAIYLVLGSTHPEVKKRYGEAYRQGLIKLSRDLGVGRHVRFVDSYLTERELVEYLLACDVYVTPYVSREQITSGTLAYALGLGKAIVSTRYYYAEEMLSGGRGILVDFRNPAGLAEAVTKVLSSDELRSGMERATALLGASMSWPKVGSLYAKIFADAATRGSLIAAGTVSKTARKTSTMR
ncbi:MAG TPA: glycosyltransferase [Firmicutes bacterium]|nr:glycosyltransferase [Bacillota bacterium]